MVVHDVEGVGHSATVHGLTDDELAGGVAIQSRLARACWRRSPVACDPGPLRADRDPSSSPRCARRPGAPRCRASSSTPFELERRAVAGSWGSEPASGALRLWTARERRALPVYRAHEALTDALACAELYLAQRASSGEAPGDGSDPRHEVA